MCDSGDNAAPATADEWKVPLLDVEEERPEGQSLGGFSHTPYAAMEMLFTHLGIGAASIVPKDQFTEYVKTAVRSKGTNPIPRQEIMPREEDGKSFITIKPPSSSVFALANRDIVVDLGCGDGRANVLAAGPIYRARGIGIDIDVDLIDRFQKKADAMNIADRLLCIVGDAVAPMQLLFGLADKDAPLCVGQNGSSNESQNEFLPLINALDNEYIGKTHPRQLERFLAVADEAFPPPNKVAQVRNAPGDKYNHSPIIDDLKLIFLYIGQHRQPLIFPVLRDLKLRCPHLIFSTAFPFNDIRTPKASSEVTSDDEPVAPIDVLPTGHITYYIYDRVPKDP